MYLAVDRLGAATAANADECATQCKANAACEFWTLCPSSQTAGCPLPPQGANTAAVTVPAGQCIITGDAMVNRTAVGVQP